MQYLAAYALVALSGKTPSKADVQAVLKAAGVAVDASRVDAVFSELDGKNFNEVMAEGRTKLGRTKLVGSGSAAPAAAACPAGAAASAAAEAKKEEPEEEADDDMGFGLFD
ncbi:hypothetical protein JIQ42_03670 [Leishmania sp. Namibia]|uniref:hypothetical protein n=1 Tax=Leishmania sp. Namibia TaxID=2802991 RepID=UPI001B688B80|nr:hypothetical protein JIQ42_03670 [Leishmania sp. Namibia]